MIRTIIKRDGTTQPYNYEKIINAIRKALQASYPERPNEEIEKDVVVIATGTSAWLHNTTNADTLHTEQVQDAIETVLMNFNYTKAAKEFILYRSEHSKLRAGKLATDIIGTYLDKSDWRVRENSNSGYCYASLMNHVAGTMIANYCLENVYSHDVANAHIEGDIHLHDLSAGVVGYCAGWSIRDLLMKGFIGKYGRANAGPAKHLDTALLQAANYLCTLQTEWAGAQAFNSFDTFMAPFVRHDNLDYDAVKQRVQQFVFGLNIASRYGQCVPATTRCLKADGTWATPDQLNIGDSIVVYDGKFKVDTITHITTRRHTGEAHKYSNKHGFNFVVTPEHRVVYKTGSNPVTIKKSSELVDCKSPIDIPVRADNDIQDYNISDDLLEFITFIMCDGSIQKTEGHTPVLHFYKSNARWGNDRFKELCGNLGIHYTVCADFGDFNTAVNAYTLLQSATTKELLTIINCTKQQLPAFMSQLSEHQAKLVIDTWAKLDGYAGSGHKRLQCDNEAIQDSLSALAIKAGYGCFKYERLIKGNKTATKYIKIYERSFKSCKVERITIDEDVWCPTTKTGTFVAMTEDGYVFITGNCPFTNLTFDLSCPEDMKQQPVIIGGVLQDSVYGDYQKEMDMINKAFIEVMMNGDKDGRIFSFPIPTYNITEDFPWDSEVAHLLFKMTGKLGAPYFQNFINTDLSPSDVRSMCCRLRLDLTDIRKHTGGLFGAGDQTGSIGVVSINIPRIAYLANKAEDPKQEFYRLYDQRLMLAKKALEAKRREINKNFDNGLMPYSQEYLPHKFDRHFSTIGVIGFNEAMRMLLGKTMGDAEAINFVKEVITYTLKRCEEFTKETGNMYNFEAVPGEGLSYRFAKIDKKKYPDIITAGTDESPYYTNSSQLPVNYTDDPFEALELQGDIQSMYSSGTVLHFYIGECIDDEGVVAKFVKNVCTKSKLPFFSLTPEFSICPKCGYIRGVHETCPNHC